VLRTLQTPPPVALSIAGSDNSAGAGIQADLKTFTSLGAYGLTAVTCVVAEVPGQVNAIATIPPEVVAEQVRLSFVAFPVAALKTGMLHSRAVIAAVVDTLAQLRSEKRGEPFPALVVDPVMVATSGAALLEPDAVEAYRTDLLPQATLVTPNLDEAAVLAGRPLDSAQAMEEAGHELCARYGTAFLLKGGHLKGEQALDLLITPDGRVETFSGPRVEGVATHGTGCTFSAAITAGLARGLSLSEAVALGKRFVSASIAATWRWQRPEGMTTDALCHTACREEPC